MAADGKDSGGHALTYSYMPWPSPNYHNGSWGGFATSIEYVQILLYDWPRKQRLWLWLRSDLQMPLRWQQMGVVDIPVNGQDPCQIVGKPQALRHRGSRHAAPRINTSSKRQRISCYSPGSLFAALYHLTALLRHMGSLVDHLFSSLLIVFDALYSPFFSGSIYSLPCSSCMGYNL